MPSLIMALKDITELFQSTLSPKATTKRTKNRYINVFFFLTIIIFFSWKEFNSLFVWFAGTLDRFRRSVWVGQSENHTKSFPIKTRFGIKCVTKSSEKSEMIHHLAHHIIHTCRIDIMRLQIPPILLHVNYDEIYSNICTKMFYHIFYSHFNIWQRRRFFTGFWRIFRWLMIHNDSCSWVVFSIFVTFFIVCFYEFLF